MRFMLLLALLIAGCGLDVIEKHYSTLDEAKGQTWLPEDILPPSTHDIDEENNVDLNDSEGEFRFAPTHADEFFSKLSPTLPRSTPYSNWDRITSRYSREGRSSWSYSDSYEETRSTWVFFCSPERDQCDFIGWYSRDGG
jgi:hypothetical protein